MKKTCIIMIGLLVLLAGCSREEIKEEDPVTFSVLYNDVAESPFSEDWLILDKYYEMKNVKLDVRLGDNSDYETAVSLSLMSDDKPDVILKCWPDTVVNYVNDGLLVPISDYVDLMPNFTKYINDNGLQDEIDKLRTSDGKYYILPGYQRDMQVQQWIYRKDAFESVGLNAPTTYDELFDSLMILKEEYPDTTPITASWGGAHLFSMIGAGYTIPAGWSGVRYYNEEKDEWLFAPATDNCKEMFRFLNKCYEADLLDSEIFTQSNDEFVAKIKDGHALVTVTWVSSGFDIWNEALAQNGYPNGEWLPLPVMESTIGTKALPPVNKFRKGLAISANAQNKEYFEEMIRFLDWAIYSEEGMRLSYWGVEGVTYEETSDGKQFLPNIITPNNLDANIDITKEYGFNAIFNMNENEEFEDSKRPDEIVEFLKLSEENNDALDMSPALNMTAEEIEIVNLINDKLMQYVNETSVKFITGEMTIDDDWNEYIEKLEDLGYLTNEITWNNAWKKNK